MSDKRCVKVLREEIVEVPGGGLQFEVETWGELHYMPRQAHSVFAIFGMFERTGESTLLYILGADEDSDVNSLDSMYLDDLCRLREGNVTIFEYRKENEK